MTISPENSSLVTLVFPSDFASGGIGILETGVKSSLLIAGGYQGAFLAKWVPFWSHFVDIYCQKLTNHPKLTFD